MKDTFNPLPNTAQETIKFWSVLIVLIGTARLTLLVLTKSDLQAAGIEEWRRFQPAAIVSQQSQPMAGVTWIGLAGRTWVSVVSDGRELWVDVEH